MPIYRIVKPKILYTTGVNRGVNSVHKRSRLKLPRIAFRSERVTESPAESGGVRYVVRVSAGIIVREVRF